MNHIFRKIGVVALGLTMAIGVGVSLGKNSYKAASADGGTLVLDGGDHKNPFSDGYSDNSTGSSTTVSDNGVVVTMKWSQTGIYDSYIQIKKNAANGFWTTTCPSNCTISSIKITVATNTANLYLSETTTFGNSTTSYTSGTALDVSSSSYKYFKITATASYTRISSLEVVYSSSVSYTSLAVDTAPTKTSYTKYETFDPTGMVVKATDGHGNYSSALTLNTHYTYSPTTALTTVGSQTITLSGAGTYQGLSGSTTVTVNALAHPLTANPGVTLSPNSTNVYEGKTASLTVTTTPSPTDEPISVTSSNDEVLAVSGTGPYTLTAGAVDSNTNVTISVAGAEGTYHTDTVFTVKPNPLTVTLDASLYEKMTLSVGSPLQHDGITASAQYESSDAYTGSFTWSYKIGGVAATTVPNDVGLNRDLTVVATASSGEYAEVTVKYDIDYAKGTENRPFTVAEAIAKIDALEAGSDTWYIRGYVKADSDNNGTYDIVDDLSADNSSYTKFFRVYKEDDYGVLKGDLVTIACKMYLYQSGNTKYYEDNGSYSLEDIEDEDITNVDLSVDSMTFTAGQKFSAAGLTADITYLHLPAEEGVDSGFTFKVDGNAIDSNTTLTRAYNGKTVVVTYEDDSGRTEEASFGLVVNYAATSSISLDEHTFTLYKNDGVPLTATLNDYADPDSVTWVSSDSTIVSVDSDGAVTSYEKAGEATVTAFYDADSDGVLDNEETIKDSCVFTVIVNKVVEIDQSVMAAFTGDDYKLIEVTNVQNFGNSPIYVWASSDEDVAEVDGDSDGAFVDIKAAGTANITLTVKDNNEDVGATATCVLTVTQSQVDTIALTATPNITTLYVGETITLTPSVTKTGNATKTVDWASNNTSAATVSVAQTENEGAITVTAVAAGSARITATSHYDGGTPKSATYDVLVKNDVLTLEWNDRGTQNFTVGDKFALKAGASLAATYENPRVDDVALTIGTSGVEVLLNGSAINASTYTFTANDDGKTVAIRYTDASSRVSTTEAETIKVLRSVTEVGEKTRTFDYKTGSKQESGDLTATIATSGYTYAETNSIRLGTGSGGGTLTVTSTGGNITKVDVYACYYSSSYTSSVFKVDGTSSGSLTSSFALYSFNIASAKASVAISTDNSSNRVKVQKVIVYASAVVDKSQSSATIELHDFINEFMHMKDVSTDNNNDTGACKGNSGYYALAKAEFNTLSAEARALFVSHSAYALEYARLAAWANANGDKFETTEGENLNKLVEKSNVNLFVTLSNNTPTIIVILSIISVSAIGGYFFLRKKKQY